MDFWVEELRKIEAITTELHRINPIMFGKLTILLLKKYVNDVLFAGLELKPGATWDSKQRALVLSSEREALEKHSNVSNEQITMKIIAEVSSDILGCLRFTWDSPNIFN